MANSRSLIILNLVLITLFTGCATFSSDVSGKYDQPQVKNTGAEDVNVFFVIRHVRQVTGFDAIPKLDNERQIIRDFDDLFLDALNEISNIGHYATFTEFSSDVSKPERRAKRDELIEASDFVLRIEFTRTRSFIRYFTGGVFSTLSLTLLPMSYPHSYSIKVDIYNSDGNMIGSYSRNATTNKWIQTFLIFAQPFHTESLKKEKIYLDFLHDIFKQIESEKILTK
ncbi:MAG: hypothetical protein GY863_19070 [bacterium]|nr:hypothetical protein [bacterium]